MDVWRVIPMWLGEARDALRALGWQVLPDNDRWVYHVRAPGGPVRHLTPGELMREAERAKGVGPMQVPEKSAPLQEAIKRLEAMGYRVEATDGGMYKLFWTEVEDQLPRQELVSEASLLLEAEKRGAVKDKAPEKPPNPEFGLMCYFRKGGITTDKEGTPKLVLQFEIAGTSAIDTIPFNRVVPLLGRLVLINVFRSQMQFDMDAGTAKAIGSAAANGAADSASDDDADGGDGDGENDSAGDEGGFDPVSDARSPSAAQAPA